MQYGVYKIMTPEECDEIRTLLDTQEWQEGQARTKELTGTIKQNLELKPEQNELVKALSAKVMQKITQHPEVIGDTLFKKATACKFNKFKAPDEGSDKPPGAYHRHTDAPWMGPVRTDFTGVLALTRADDYEGGDHHVVDPHSGEMIFRPDIGELMIYETRWAHWVDPVTKGSRICALTWLESCVPDQNHRALLKLCRGISRDMEARMDNYDPDCPFRKWFVDNGQIHSSLMREWAQRS